jgi:Pyruvate/2-oxoacid:ferredoxin oxidoreductase delta subunit
MRRKQIDIDWIIKNHSSFFAKFNLNEAKIREHYEVWKIGKISTAVNDYYWYLLQNIITVIAEQVSSEEETYQLNYETYLKMWEFLVGIERKNGNHVKRTMHQNELRLWKLQSPNYKKEVVIISGACCSYCNELNGKRIDFEEALEKQYLASESCTREAGCNCCYSVLNSRDDNGRLIRIANKL